MLFGAIELVREKGIEAWRYREQGKLADIAFRFAEEADPGRLAQGLAARLQLYTAARSVS